MANEIDLYVGKRLRQRRRLLGMTQQKLAEEVAIRFQQIQKYESGANRISASRLWSLARALDVPVGFFFEGLNGGEHEEGDSAERNGFHDAKAPADVFASKETIDLVRAFYTLEEEPRRRLLDLAKAMSGTDRSM
jgi:transcriptional regulator with XRE-family HTH domain